MKEFLLIVKEFGPYFATIVSGFGAVWISSRFKKSETQITADSNLTAKSIEDRQKFSDQVLLEMHQTKEDLKTANAKIEVLNLQVIVEQKKNAELSVKLATIMDELTQLKAILRQIDPENSGGKCALFNTEGCPFTRVKRDYLQPKTKIDNLLGENE